jgi:UrcA family protein
MSTLSITGSLLLSLLSPAMAGEPASATVETHDLDLAVPEDQARLETRVRSAARRICATNSRSIADLQFERACIADALSGAMPAAERAIAEAQAGQRVRSAARARGARSAIR